MCIFYIVCPKSGHKILYSYVSRLKNIYVSKQTPRQMKYNTTDRILLPATLYIHDEYTKQGTH